MGVVAFAGSRSLAGADPEKLVGRIVAKVQAAGRGIVTGCAVGADRMVVEAALSCGAKPQVFAAFGFAGQGAWKGSAVATVQAAAAVPGLDITWWAGGGPDVALTTRLRERTLAMVRRVAESGDGKGLVAFVNPDSKGTLLTIREAVKLRIPVVVFCFDGAPLPQVRGGRWEPAGQGLWAHGWRFV